MNRAARQRSAALRLTESISGGAPASETMQIVVDEARRLTGASTAAICLLTDGQEMLDFVAVSGENASEIVGLRIRSNDSLSETVIATGEPALFSSGASSLNGSLFAAFDEPYHTDISGVYPRPISFSEDRLRDRSLPLPLSASGTRTAAVVPLYQDKRLIGTLSALNRQEGEGEAREELQFSLDDLENLTMLAGFATHARSLELQRRQLREQTRELSALYEATRTVNGSLNVGEVLESVLDAVCGHVEHHSAMIFLLNDERTRLFIESHRGLIGDECELQLLVEDGLIAEALETGEPRIIHEADGESLFSELLERVTILSSIIAPLRSRDEVHGLLIVNSLSRGAYHPDDLKLVNTMAMHAGIAIQNAWLYEEAQRQAEEAAALYDLSQHVNATLDIDKVLAFVADSVVNLLKADGFALMLYDRTEGRLVTRMTRGIDGGAFCAIKPQLGEGIAGWVYEWQTPQAVSDVAADARNRTSPIDGLGIASALSVPLGMGDEVIGVIQAFSSRRRLFTVAEMELLYTIANQAAGAIINSTLYHNARARSLELRRYFRRISQAVGSALGEQDLPQLMADLSLEMLQADRCAIYRQEGETLKLCAASRFRGQNPPEETIASGKGLAGWVSRRGQYLAVTALEEDPRSRVHAWISRDHVSSCLIVPLRNLRQTVGVIELYSLEPREFTREEARMLAAFCRRARLPERLTSSGVSK